MDSDVMREILIHGRGGQGGVLAATILAQGALYKSDKNTSQSFPKFGAERRGAYVKSFCRLGRGKIKRHSQIYQSDISVVLDETLLAQFEPKDVMKNGGILLINTEKKPDIDKGDKEFSVYWVDATSIALDMELKVSGQAVVNTTMLGAVLQATEDLEDMKELIDLPSLQEAIKDRLKGEVGVKNAAAAERAMKETKVA